MVTVEHDYDLSGRNTFRMRVSCDTFVEYSSSQELQALDFDSLPGPWLHIGAGSNLLFTGDFHGTVFHSAIRYVKYVDMGLDEVLLTVGSGVVLDDLVKETCGYGLWGLENLSFIPGEVGAAAVQNVGAYGVEAKDVVAGVVCFDFQERKKVIFKTPDCAYGYRDSRFKREKGRYVVTSVLFRLSRKYNPRLEYKGIRQALGLGESECPKDLTPDKVREAVISVRKQKLPDPEEIGSAGSFFKNPVVSALQFAEIIDIARRDFGEDVVVPHYVNTDGSIKIPAAWLIDKSGLKASCEGGAAVYEKQPLVIVNASGTALPEDVVKLENRIVDTVKDHFGIELHPEVEHL
ncbi:MAG: UDP-N-acetylmuramate dehydrogenase [Bacteroidales bacterium]|nr:UDP-N-acetylmuramate dehydrogenase [Bacteroidales bacterium]